MRDSPAPPGTERRLSVDMGRQRLGRPAGTAGARREAPEADQPVVHDQRAGERQVDREPGRNLDDMGAARRSEEHTSELQSLMRISYAVFCLKKKTTNI